MADHPISLRASLDRPRGWGSSHGTAVGVPPLLGWEPALGPSLGMVNSSKAFSPRQNRHSFSARIRTLPPVTANYPTAAPPSHRGVGNARGSRQNSACREMSSRPDRGRFSCECRRFFLISWFRPPAAGTRAGSSTSSVGCSRAPTELQPSRSVLPPRCPPYPADRIIFCSPNGCVPKTSWKAGRQRAPKRPDVFLLRLLSNLGQKIRTRAGYVGMARREVL